MSKITKSIIRKSLYYLFIFVLIVVPFVLTLLINQYISYKNLSPVDEDSHALENHLSQKTWIFTLLKLGGELPFYKIEPNFEKIGPAMTQTAKIGNKEIIINTVPYDSLSCLSEKIKNTNQKDLNSIKWTDCKFKKDFPWGYATGDDPVRINISLGPLGFIIIYFVNFTLIAGFFLLILNLLKTFYEVIHLGKKEV